MRVKVTAVSRELFFSSSSDISAELRRTFRRRCDATVKAIARISIAFFIFAMINNKRVNNSVYACVFPRIITEGRSLAKLLSHDNSVGVHKLCKKLRGSLSVDKRDKLVRSIIVTRNVFFLPFAYIRHLYYALYLQDCTSRLSRSKETSMMHDVRKILEKQRIEMRVLFRFFISTDKNMKKYYTYNVGRSCR